MTTRDPNGADTKLSNPKDAAATGRRVCFSVLPVRALVGAALALSEGAHKYGRHNYREAGVRASVYFDAMARHLFAWWEGEDIDPASGVHHLDKLIAGALVVRDAMIGDMCTDDRPPSAPDGWVNEANTRYAALMARMRAEHGEAKAPFVRAMGDASARPAGRALCFEHGGFRFMSDCVECHPPRPEPTLDGNCWCSEYQSSGLPCLPGKCPNAPRVHSQPGLGRLKVGDRVRVKLSGWPYSGEAGRLVFDDGSDVPYIVEVREGKKCWYRLDELEPDTAPPGEPDPVE